MLYLSDKAIRDQGAYLYLCMIVIVAFQSIKTSCWNYPAYNSKQCIARL